jgi:hypothetical protein
MLKAAECCKKTTLTQRNLSFFATFRQVNASNARKLGAFCLEIFKKKKIGAAWD